MIPLLNDFVRWALLPVLWALGVLSTIEMRLRIVRFREEQRTLARRYGIAPATPIRPFDEATRRSIEAYAAQHPDAAFATTSGSTGAPKRVAYTRARLRAIKRENLSALSRILLATGTARPVIFILSSLKEEGSLASLITAGSPAPGWLEGLVVPTRTLAHPAVEPLIDRYGAAAVRLWLLVLSNPGLIYSTNPSTLAVFLREVHDRWEETTRLIRDLVRDPVREGRAGAAEWAEGAPGSQGRGALGSGAAERFAPEVHRVAARVASLGAARRMAVVAGSARPLPVEAWLPGLRAFCAWDGGYVRPFLDQIRRFLPEGRVAHVPMYAMSTETLMTLLVYEGRRPRFLPIAPGVLYEFLPAEDADDRVERLLPAWRLVPGRSYAMVVSDGYGLRRYQTDDLFLCKRRVGGLPDLAFQRRRGLSYSFTGEKITGEQVERALEAIRGRFPSLAHLQMTLAPSLPPGAPLPRYRLFLAHAAARPPEGLERDLTAIARSFDEALCALNSELAGKLRSARLAPTEAEAIPYDDLAARLDPRTRDESDRSRRTWESQWKLVPLMRTLV